MKRKRGKKIWPSLTGIWTPDFSTNSRPKFEIWGRLDLSSPGFLELLDFTSKYLNCIIFEGTYSCGTGCQIEISLLPSKFFQLLFVGSNQLILFSVLRFNTGQAPLKLVYSSEQLFLLVFQSLFSQSHSYQILLELTRSKFLLRQSWLKSIFAAFQSGALLKMHYEYRVN